MESSPFEEDTIEDLQDKLSHYEVKTQRAMRGMDIYRHIYRKIGLDYHQVRLDVRANHEEDLPATQGWPADIAWVLDQSFTASPTTLFQNSKEYFPKYQAEVVDCARIVEKSANLRGTFF
jgi:hypothetical protein